CMTNSHIDDRVSNARCPPMASGADAHSCAASADLPLDLWFRATRDEVISGAQGRNRTTDTVIFSHVLYQLSYLGGHNDPSRLARRRFYRGSGRACPAHEYTALEGNFSARCRPAPIGQNRSSRRVPPSARGGGTPRSCPLSRRAAPIPLACGKTDRKP